MNSDMQPGANLNTQNVHMAASQMAHMSISGGVPGHPPSVHPQIGMAANQTTGHANMAAGQLPYPVQTQFPTNQVAVSSAIIPGQSTVGVQTSQPIIPSTLNVMPAQLQQQQQQSFATGLVNGVGGQANINPNLIQSPLSPLTNNAALFGQNPIQNPLGQSTALRQDQTGSPVISPSTPPIVPNPLTQAYGFQNQIGSYPNNDAQHILNNNKINNSTNQLLSHQQQLQLLQQKQLQHQQIFQQTTQQNFQHQHQQLANQSLNNPNFQPLPQGLQGMTSIQSTNPYIANSIAQMTIMPAAPIVSAEINPNVNTLPHTLPTTLNPSLKKKPIRNVLNSSSGSMSPVSPRNGMFQDSWDIYDDSNTSGVGSSISSPMSPGAGWSEYVIPRYDAPAAKDHCLKCNQKVYAMEKVGPVRDVLYHKNCFTCVACGTKLSLKNFHHNPNDQDDYNVFCASHKPRTVNIASEGNAFYVPKSSPRVNQMAYQEPDPRYTNIEQGQCRTFNEDQTDGLDHLDGCPNVPLPENPESPESKEAVEDKEATNPDQPKPETNLEDDITKVEVTQIPQSDTPSGSRKSVPSNSGSSPFSSVSSSSSYATSLKTEGTDEFDFKTKDNETDFPSKTFRKDRPSSMSSVSTTSSTECLKMKVGRDRVSSSEQQETSSIASHSSLERPDRPSAIQRSVSSTEQPVNNKVLSDLKNSGKMLVKSHSSQDFSHNDLKRVVEPRRHLPRNESMRLDRPSQYQ